MSNAGRNVPLTLVLDASIECFNPHVSHFIGMTLHSCQVIHFINISFLPTKISLQTLGASGPLSTTPYFVAELCRFPSAAGRAGRSACGAAPFVRSVPSHSI